jgi:carboxyl-terminal processing protease
MNRVARIILALGLVMVTGSVMFAGGFVAGQWAERSGALSFLTGGPSASAIQSGTPSELQTTFRPFWEAWDIVHREYADQPVDDVALMQGAIRGMLQALGDPHTAYMTPDEVAIASTHLDGELEGIGATVETAGSYTRIVSPLPGSPAEQVGVLPGDLIIKINGEDIADQALTTVVSKVRGPAGSSVVLTIQREGESDLLEFTIVRAKITIPSVESQLLRGNVGYVKINSFGDKTDGELSKQLRDLMAQRPVGLILDLRGNPGGYLTTAVDVVSQFIPDGVVMLERFGDGREKTYTAEGNGIATDIPLVVLVDKGSASASEIVAGAIQDRQRGTIVGEQSYGKGSVQQPHNLSGPNGGEVRVTIARWLTPNGNWIHKTGITPDVAVERTPEDREANRDPQLEKAIEVLTNE